MTQHWHFLSSSVSDIWHEPKVYWFSIPRYSHFSLPVVESQQTYLWENTSFEGYTVCVLWELTKTLFKQLYTFLTTVLHWSIVKDLKFEGLWDSVLNVVDDSVTDTEKVGSLKLLNNHSQSCFIVLLLFIKSFSDIFKYQAGIKLPSEHLAEPFVGS